ncbi:MAG: hypothetical protein O3A00_02535 [Planctomycetota bacterium]|nr:hypothetical protein [Planctomycetota bacterium]
MAYEPQFSISLRLLSLVESVAALRERIQSATVELMDQGQAGRYRTRIIGK